MTLTSCPACGSTLLQPLRCDASAGPAVVVDLRCPECQSWLQAPYSKAEVAELDRSQAQWRRELVAAYERSVAESMEALAECLVPALALDLIGADDFAVSRPPRPGGS